MKNIEIVVDSLNVVLKKLGEVADQAEARTLEELAFAYAQQAECWRNHPPTSEQRETLMRNVLALQIAASRVGRRRS